MKAQRAALVAACLCLPVFAVSLFEVQGRTEPPVRASVSLHGATTPFAASTLSDSAGRFKFTNIDPGTYTVIVFVPAMGESRSTIDVGPGTADNRNRVTFTVHLEESGMQPSRHQKVSVRELSIPSKALREYQQAERDLRRKDSASAESHLKNAVGIAPQFANAWNLLGTMAYKSQRYEGAEDCFRRALAAEPGAYEPLVNLGGVLLNLGKVQEAWDHNVHAVLARPNDALANSQLGMTYFAMGKADLALKYLNEARRLDPGHFSNPQLLAAEIYLRRRQWSEAAETLEEFLFRHPDWPQAEQVRNTVARLRQKTQ